MPVLEHESSPAFADDHEVGSLGPALFGKFDEEWVRIGLHNVGVPVTMVFISHNHVAVHEVFRSIGGETVFIDSLELFDVWLHDLWPSLTVVKMNTIDVMLVGVCENLVDLQVPALDLSVVEHGGIHEVLGLTIGTVADFSPAVLIKIVKKQVLIFSVVSARANPCQRVDDDLHVSRVGLLNDSFEASVTSEHFVGCITSRDGHRRCVILSVLDIVRIAALELMIVPRKRSHEVERRNTLFGISVDGHLDVSEVTSLEELVGVFIELRILVIDLDFMESVVSHSSGVDDESTLGNVDVAIFLVIVVIFLLMVDNWEHWIRVPNNLTRNELSYVTDFKKSPIEETTLVELSKVDRDLDGLIILVEDVRFIDLMPSDDVLVITLNWRWCSEA